MAKKYARREHVSVRKKREEEQKRQNRKKLTKQQWLMIAGATAIVLAVVLFFVLRAPAGALPVRNGAVVKGADNWIVANLNTDGKPYYFHTANYDAPTGFTRDLEYTVKSDPLVDEVYLKPDGENAAITMAYITTVTGSRLADEMLETVKQYYTEVAGPDELTVNGYTWKYMLGNSTFVENEGDVQRGGTFYLDSPDGRYSIACTTQTKNFTTATVDDMPSDEQILSDITPVLESVTLPEK